MDDIVITRDRDDVEMEDDEIDRLKKSASKRKGRGLAISEVLRGDFDEIEGDTRPGGPQKSIEGWIIFVTNVHIEATENDIFDKFSEFGDIKNLHANLDRRTGYLKGYVCIEYEQYNEARAAVEQMNNEDFLGQELKVDWAFVRPGKKSSAKRKERRRGRSPSPETD